MPNWNIMNTLLRSFKIRHKSFTSCFYVEVLSKFRKFSSRYRSWLCIWHIVFVKNTSTWILPIHLVNYARGLGDKASMGITHSNACTNIMILVVRPEQRSRDVARTGLPTYLPSECLEI